MYFHFGLSVKLLAGRNVAPGVKLMAWEDNLETNFRKARDARAQAIEFDNRRNEQWQRGIDAYWSALSAALQTKMNIVNSRVGVQLEFSVNDNRIFVVDRENSNYGIVFVQQKPPAPICGDPFSVSGEVRGGQVAKVNYAPQFSAHLSDSGEFILEVFLSGMEKREAVSPEALAEQALGVLVMALANR